MVSKMTFKERYNASEDDRFWSYVQKTDEGCWEWSGGLYSSGYGQFRGSETRAHRMAFVLTKGKIPKGQIVCHSCDNKKCVNPDHLFLGTTQDNIDDKVSKGRQAQGETQHLSKFTEKQVLEIRSRYEGRQLKIRDPVDGIKALAKEFGVFEQAIRSIINRSTWRHI